MTKQKQHNAPAFVGSTKKIFYGKYLIRATLLVTPVERTILSLCLRKAAAGKTLSLSSEDGVSGENSTQFVKTIKAISSTWDCKYLLSFWRLHIFLVDEHALSKLLDIPECKSRIQQVVKPSSEDAARELLKGALVCSLPFKYKITISWSVFPTNDVDKMFSLIDESLSQKNAKFLGTKRKASRPGFTILSGAIYINDETLITLFALINPEFVKKVHYIIPPG